MADGGNVNSAVPIYQNFVSLSKRLNPRYLVMVLPSRWFSGGRGLDKFREEMLNDDRIRIIHDFPRASDCFPDVEIKGGVCYFLWSRDNRGLCTVISHNGGNTEESTRSMVEKEVGFFIRDEMSVNILHKVMMYHEESIITMLKNGRFFGFHTKIEWTDESHGNIQTSDGKHYIEVSKNADKNNPVKVYIHHGFCFINEARIPKNREFINQYKIIIPRSGNLGSTILGQPKISEPGSCCSNSFVAAILPEEYSNSEYADNVISYLNTRFVRFLISLRTTTQNMSPKVYQFVPVQDFSYSWTDEILYSKYGFSEKETKFINSKITRF